MKSGATSLELDITYDFSPDGAIAKLTSVCIDGKRLPSELGKRLLMALSRSQQGALVDEAWANAEDETDDAECDDERIAGAAQ